MPHFRLDESEVFRVPFFESLPWLDHGFGTRNATDWTHPNPATLRQIHSNSVITVGNGGGCVGEGDAMITGRSGIRLEIRTADCVPILMAAPGKRVVAAVHAGWRGTAKSIIVNTIRQFEREFDCPAEQLLVAIGPAIGVCCYQVGVDVAVQFSGWSRPPSDGPLFLDLIELNRSQALDAGVPACQVFAHPLCTRCLPGQFHSYRRDGERAGRMVSAIMVRECSGPPATGTRGTAANCGIAEREHHRVNWSVQKNSA